MKRATRPTAYGYLRIHAELCEAGAVVGKHRVAFLMTQMGLKTRCRRRFQVTTQSARSGFQCDPSLVDITYIATREGWIYLTGVLDTYSRRIVGWSMSERITMK